MRVSGAKKLPITDLVLSSTGTWTHHEYSSMKVSSQHTRGRHYSSLSNNRTTFPNATVIPKLHMLEEHVLPFLRKWRVGFGFHGEQGAEALHRGFNRIKASYTSIPDALKRLMCVVREHHLQVSPVLVAQEPTKKKRKTL